jgi:hypothetical protein
MLLEFLPRDTSDTHDLDSLKTLKASVLGWKRRVSVGNALAVICSGSGARSNGLPKQDRAQRIPWCRWKTRSVRTALLPVPGAQRCIGLRSVPANVSYSSTGQI